MAFNSGAFSHRSLRKIVISGKRVARFVAVCNSHTHTLCQQSPRKQAPLKMCLKIEIRICDPFNCVQREAGKPGYP